MSDEKLENLIKSAKISLSKEEKAHLRKNILSQMENVQLPFDSVSQKTHFSIWRLLNTPSLKYAFVALVPVLILASTASAAQGSLPGDLLYPVKTGFNEKLSGIFYLTDESKAKRETVLLERRLSEAQKLASRGELSEGRKQTVERQFNKHSQRVRDHVRSLESQKNFGKALALQSDLEISLELHGKLLASTEESNPSEGQLVASRVAQELSVVSQEKAAIARNLENEPQLDNSRLARSRLSEAQKLLKEVEVFSNKERGKEPIPAALTATEEIRETSLSAGGADSVHISATVSVPAWEARAKEKIKEGETLLQAQLYTEATNAFNEAIKILREVKLAEESEIQLDVFVGVGMEEKKPDRVIETVDIEKKPDTGDKSVDIISDRIQTKEKDATSNLNPLSN